MTDLLLVLRSVIVTAAIKSGLNPTPVLGEKCVVVCGRGLTVIWRAILTPDGEIEAHWTIIGHSPETRIIRNVNDIQRFASDFTAAIEEAAS